MKKSSKFAAGVIFLLFTCYLLLVTSPVSAHYLKNDGNMGIVLHVEPDDDPAAGEQAAIMPELKDRTYKFKAEDCICSIIITEQDTKIFEQDLYQGTDPKENAPHISFVFPKKDVYQITFSGKPVKSGEFGPFTIVYDWRVDREAKPTDVSIQPTSNLATTTIAPNNPKPWYIRYTIILGGSIAFLIFITVYIVMSIWRKPTQTPVPQNPSSSQLHIKSEQPK